MLLNLSKTTEGLNIYSAMNYQNMNIKQFPRATLKYAPEEVEQNLIKSYTNNLELIKDKLKEENREATSSNTQSDHLSIKIGYRKTDWYTTPQTFIGFR